MSVEITRVPQKPRRHTKIAASDAIERLYHLHRRQAVLNKLEQALDRVGIIQGTLSNIMSTKGFLDDLGLSQADALLKECLVILSEARMKVDEAVRDDDKLVTALIEDVQRSK